MKNYISLPQWGKGDRVAVDEVSYVSPELEIINLVNTDIITNSGTETTQVENTDGIWDLNQNA